MKMLKSFFDFYIYSSIHVALSAFSLSWITLLNFEISFHPTILFFIFFATITGYNFVKFFGLAKFHYRGLVPWLKAVQVLSLFSFVLMCFFAFGLKMITMVCIVGFGLLTFLYAVPFFPQHMFMDEQRNLRNIGGLKVYVIALVWAGVTVLLPLINNGYVLNTDVWIVTAQRFIFVVIIMLPFEIRDLRYDSLKLATIPQKIGVKNTKIIGVLLGLSYILLEFFKDTLKINQLIIALSIIFLALLLLIIAKKNQNSYYSSFWVESIPIFWLSLCMMF